MMGQRQPPGGVPRDVVGALEAEFDVRSIDLTEGKPIPRQIAVLLIIRPENLSDKAIYEIDQFLMRGGRLVVCADAFSFDLETRDADRRTPNTIKKVELDGFRKFLRHLGADVGDSMILDTKSESRADDGARAGGGEIEFFDIKLPYFVYVEAPDGFDKTHDIVGEAAFVLLEWATPVRRRQGRARRRRQGGEARRSRPASRRARSRGRRTRARPRPTSRRREAQERELEYKPPARREARARRARPPRRLPLLLRGQADAGRREEARPRARARIARPRAPRSASGA